MTADAYVAWAAGFFEGEGSFSCSTHRQYQMSVGNTDIQMLKQYHGFVGGLGNIYEDSSQFKRGFKRSWTWKAHRSDDVDALMELFWPWLSWRRRERYLGLVTERAVYMQGRRTSKVCACGAIFTSIHRQQVWCSIACSQRSWARAERRKAQIA